MESVRARPAGNPTYSSAKGSEKGQEESVPGNEKKQQEIILKLLKDLPLLENHAKEALAEYLTYNSIEEEDLLLILFSSFLGEL